MSSRQFYTTVRIFRSGFVNLFRNAWLTIAATAVMVVALTIIMIAVVLNLTANNAIDEIALDLKAEVYLNDGISDTALSEFRSEIEGLDFVVAVEYISQDDANRLLTEKFEGTQQALIAADGAGGGTLPASLRIAVNDLERMPEIKDFAENSQYAGIIEDVSLGKDDNSAQETINRAAAGQRYINTGSIVAAGILSAVAVMIIFNTIRMAIYTRRDEIRIMKLIGATPGYIRGPFIIEASLYGVFAGLISSAAVYSLIVSLGSRVATEKEFEATYSFFTQPSIVVAMTASAVTLGILIGCLSSMMAMEKHLKLKHW